MSTSKFDIRHSALDIHVRKLLEPGQFPMLNVQYPMMKLVCPYHSPYLALTENSTFRSLLRWSASSFVVLDVTRASMNPSLTNW